MIIRLFKGILKQLKKLYYAFKPYVSWLLCRVKGVDRIDPYDIPIIINNRNRYSCLKRLISALETRVIEIYIYWIMTLHILHCSDIMSVNTLTN